MNIDYNKVLKLNSFYGVKLKGNETFDELLEIERKQKEQQLVDSNEVKATWLQLIAIAKTKVLGIPSKAKQRIPDLDVSAMNCLEDIVRESLEEIADTQAA